MHPCTHTRLHHINSPTHVQPHACPHAPPCVLTWREVRAWQQAWGSVRATNEVAHSWWLPWDLSGWRPQQLVKSQRGVGTLHPAIGAVGNPPHTPRPPVKRRCEPTLSDPALSPPEGRGPTRGAPEAEMHPQGPGSAPHLTPSQCPHLGLWAVPVQGQGSGQWAASPPPDPWGGGEGLRRPALPPTPTPREQSSLGEPPVGPPGR